MAEPILGQALALQSEFRPDTTQVLTKAVDKIGNATLKKQIAEAKAAEAKAKRQQEIAGMVKLDGVKVNTHYAQDVKDIVSDSYAKMIEASQRGDGIAINQLKTQAELELKNKVQQSEDQNKFLESEKQGFIVPQQIKIAFGMPRAEGQKYLKALLEQNPEYAAIVDMNQYGDYSYNTIKNIELETEFTRILDMNDNLYSPTGKKVIDEKSKDQLEIYKISDDNIRQFAKIKSTDPEFRANIFLKNKQDLQPIAASILAADKTLTPQQASEMAVEGYIYKQLSDRNQKTVKSNIPQGKSDSGTSFTGGVKTTNGWLISPSTLKTGARTKAVDPVLVQRLADTNKLTEEYNKTVPYNKRRPLKTYDEAYGAKATNFDEVYFENKDVPENKTFKMPDGQGGLISMIPLSLRRAKGTENWELVGKQIMDDGEEVDMKVPLTSDVIGKLDVLFGESTRGILNKLYGGSTKKGTPAPKGGTATVKGGNVR
jgi:hypothetical protein